MRGEHSGAFVDASCCPLQKSMTITRPLPVTITVSPRQSIRKGHGNAPSPSKKIQRPLPRLSLLRVGVGDRVGANRQASCDIFEYQKDKGRPGTTPRSQPKTKPEKEDAVALVAPCMVSLVREQAKAAVGVGRWENRIPMTRQPHHLMLGSRLAHRPAGYLFSPML